MPPPRTQSRSPEVTLPCPPGLQLQVPNIPSKLPYRANCWLPCSRHSRHSTPNATCHPTLPTLVTIFPANTSPQLPYRPDPRPLHKPTQDARVTPTSPPHSYPVLTSPATMPKSSLAVTLPTTPSFAHTCLVALQLLPCLHCRAVTSAPLLRPPPPPLCLPQPLSSPLHTGRTLCGLTAGWGMFLRNKSRRRRFSLSGS
jgi:hypothetical protein